MNTQTQASSLAVRIGMHSVAGPRAENQDAVGARVPAGNLLQRKGVAFAIADGVSASEAGRLAAEACVQNFLGDFFATPDTWSIKRSGGAVLDALNRWLLGQGLRFRDTQRGYVSTFTGCVLQARQLHVFHVGDTRLYRLRAGQLELLTRDHRVLLDDGSPVLGRAMGLDHRVDIDYATHDAQCGDTYLLLTDGIHDLLDNTTIAAVLLSGKDAQNCCTALVDGIAPETAVDNMSAVLVQIDTLPEANATEHLLAWEKLPLLPLLQEGQRLDGLRVERLLAESPRSQVYRVRDEKNGARFVLKTPSPRCTDIAAAQQEYATENWVLRRVAHPRLPRASDPPHTRSALYLLLEPVEGIPLRQWMREQKQAPVAEALQITRQIALALRALHRRDIVHRDIRPENVLLDGNGQITVIDLGQCRVAALQTANGGADPYSGPGALEYAAPECSISPQHAGERGDQFSLAALLYEMLTGTLPFGDNLVAAHINSKSLGKRAFDKLQLMPASRINPMLPVWLDAVFARALALDPAQRFGDIAEFSDALTPPKRKMARNESVPLDTRLPLSERNPLRFWQAVATLLALGNLFTLFCLLRK